MSLSPFWIPIIAGVGGAVLTDLLVYQAALSKSAGDPSIPEPKFNWKLFGTRALIGFITGLLAGLGINGANQSIGGAS